jgi:hypothetical protein
MAVFMAADLHNSLEQLKAAFETIDNSSGTRAVSNPQGRYILAYGNGLDIPIP